ncbi:MAG: copper resistance protein CopZ [Alphaproteobacteria bacterium]|nr:copper resistance protein CopZ [Alphaproteobacteria bacterium]
MNILLTTALLPLLALAGCKDDVAARNAPSPVELTADAAGYYCQMLILEHEGPKAQIHLAGSQQPLWFAQVRDGIAYLRSPEQSAEITGFYVSDMAKAASWQEPGANNWITANDAFYVVGSDARGGMGAPELAPFGTQADAAVFAAAHGGMVMRLADIPADAVLAPVEIGAAGMEGMKMSPAKPKAEESR